MHIPNNLNYNLKDIEARLVRETYRKIAIPCTEGFQFIEVDEILYLEADSNYTNVFLIGSKKIITSKTLGKIEEILPNNFVRVHAAYIINLKKIQKYLKGDGGQVIMENGITVPVSRAQKQTFLKRVMKDLC